MDKLIGKAYLLEGKGKWSLEKSLQGWGGGAKGCRSSLIINP